MFTYSYFKAPVGLLTLLGNESGLLHVIDIVSEEATALSRWKQTLGVEPQRNAVLYSSACKQFDAYFAGQLRVFALPWAPLRGTPFQRAVWSALAAIPFGEVQSYGELAKSIGRPLAARAVGGACGANPLPIVIPCHRAVGSGGALGGFGLGLDMKRQLLALEQR